ncbi:uncharacterized protein LOC121246650 [Juglans microcarpa x Juglans regia]|uniref:uncharacterized protein LOC121246650 n=1 Tax=Juglans microcarpa x Juglans regia TaxID=2249226 RepID=UPI001B7EC2A2|nr:uncharacterized protein LOC121246650 [Juglans microcarpa x Juglans regia]
MSKFGKKGSCKATSWKRRARACRDTFSNQVHEIDKDLEMYDQSVKRKALVIQEGGGEKRAKLSLRDEESGITPMKSDIILLSWNCRGLGNARTVCELHLLVKKKGPKIIFLLETKCMREKVEGIRNKLGFECSFVVDSIRKSGGLAMLWKVELQAELFYYSQNHISLSISLDDGDQKYGAANRPFSQMEKFREALDACELCDLGYDGSQFTWSNKREDAAFIKERLDRAFGNYPWHLLFSHTRVRVLPVLQYDHSPLLISCEIDDGINRRPTKVFRYEASWSNLQECKDIIQKTWRVSMRRDNSLLSLKEVLSRCRSKLTVWSKIKGGEKKRILNAKRGMLQEFQRINKGDFNDAINHLQEEVDTLMEEEETKWRQRSKQLWLKEGDKNSNFFHRCATQRRQSNEIKEIENERGEKARNQMEISQLFQEYYQFLFKTSNPRDIDAALCDIESLVTPEMNRQLEKECSFDEVKKVVFEMDSLSSQGPDGFSAGFYQDNWAVVGSEVFLAVKDFLSSRRGLSGINETFIALIPKKNKPRMVTEFRPISLCNVLYKIVSKVLANRLKQFLPSLISHSQSVFVSGRLISANIIVAYEAMHSMQHRMRGKKEGYMALKLDMSKAYDRIEWNFLAAVLKKMGFGEEWSEVLGKLLDKAKEKGFIYGFPFARGQRLNLEKTTIYFSKNTSQAAKDAILSGVRLMEARSFEKYLGLPSYVGRHKVAAFRPILESIRNRMNNWKVNFLSKAGKEVMLKSIVQAIPTYCMSIFKLPKAVLTAINKLMKKFWWGSKDERTKTQWISWKQMGRPKGEEGLGYRDFEEFNLALIAKQGWRVIQQPSSLAARVLKAKYFHRSNFLHAKVGMNIWSNKWLPRPSTYKVQSPHIESDDGRRVSDLIDKQAGVWDMNILRELFVEEEVNLICRSVFTVRSAYHLAGNMAADQKGQSSYSVKKETSHQIWKRRNNFVFKGKFTDPNFIVQTAMQKVSDFQVANQKQVAEGVTAYRVSQWTAPPSQVFKAN